MRLPIILYPDYRLKRMAEPVKVITDELVELLDNMQETMVAHDGVGLSAPQVGVNLQIAIVEADEGEVIELINPKIIKRSGEDIDVEGCLSLPGKYGTVKRSTEITVIYFDREGDELEMEAFDYLARIIQHEVDHLQGKVFIDKQIEAIPEAELEKYMEEHQHD
ncbi:peptide deformylase [Enterococcus sp. HY326]|uniref:peptide deformylase n=1 Tax=Enterococcus sp. HY326 TaxID=2971265 RepID=UPI00223F3B80|nr:peptide deformylase [Enterococcus sp. HY326]